MGDDGGDGLPPRPALGRVAVGFAGMVAVVIFVPVLVDHRFNWVSSVEMIVTLTAVAAWYNWPYVRSWWHSRRG